MAKIDPHYRALRHEAIALVHIGDWRGLREVMFDLESYWPSYTEAFQFLDFLEQIHQTNKTQS